MGVVGGIAGVAYVTAAILPLPRRGAAGFMTAVIAGQVVASPVIDYFGAVGLAARPIDPARLLGASIDQSIDHVRGDRHAVANVATNDTRVSKN